MSLLHRGLASLFAVLLDPAAALGPLGGLAVISAVSGIVLLFAFRWTSDPRAIRTARGRVQAHLLAVRLYRDDLGVVFRSQLRLLAALGSYMGQMMLPFVALLVPFGLLFAHLDARYASRALHPGERALVKAVAAGAALDGWKLEAGDGVVVESAPVRIPSRREIVWRVRAKAPGSQELTLVWGETRVAKEIRVADEDVGVSRVRGGPDLSSLFTAAAEDPIDASSGIASIEVTYPPLPLVAFGVELHWIVVFVVVSAAVAFGLRKRAGVEF